MTRATGAPGLAGDDVLGSQRAVIDDLTGRARGEFGVPFCARLPQRGPESQPVGRAVGQLAEMAAERGVHDWQLADRPGSDVRHARAAIAQDRDDLAVAALGYRGSLVVDELGPWSLCAQLYTARQDRVLADAGAVRAVVDAYCAGLVDELQALVRAVPGVDSEVIVRLAEPTLAAVLVGAIPTFSGRARIRAIDRDVVIAHLNQVVVALQGAGARVVLDVHAAKGAVPVAIAAGPHGVGTDLGAWDEQAWTAIAQAVESGLVLYAGVPAVTVSSCSGVDVGAIADAVSVPWRRMGLTVAGMGDVVLTSADRWPLPNLTAARGTWAALLAGAELLSERAAS